MPDSVSCSSNSPGVWTCEVADDGAGEAPSAGSSSAAKPTLTAAPPPADPAVSALVNAYSHSVVTRADAPLVTGESLLKCGSNELSVGLALVASKLPIIAGFKAGLDLGKCLAEAHDAAVLSATEQKGADSCVADGGRVSAIIDSHVYCDMTGAVR